MARSGADLALLMLAGFRVLVADARVELAARGYEDVRPTHDFALHAIVDGADTASALAKRMGVTKQTTAETISTLVARGYIERESDPEDRRRVRLRVTERGAALMRDGELVFDGLRQAWEAQVGASRVAELENAIKRLVGDDILRPGAPGSMVETAEK